MKLTNSRYKLVALAFVYQILYVGMYKWYGSVDWSYMGLVHEEENTGYLILAMVL